MSRGRDAITKQAASQGWKVVHIEWEPISAGAEKSGPDGGWEVELERDGRPEWAGGYNVAQVIEWIKNLDRPFNERTDPFECSGKSASRVAGDCALARGHRGKHWPIGPDGRMVPESGR